VCAANILIGLRRASARKCASSLAMPDPELFLLFVRPLNRAGIRYVVSGSVATNPRAEGRKKSEARNPKTSWKTFADC